jgi:hypothetical protein
MLGNYRVATQLEYYISIISDLIHYIETRQGQRVLYFKSLRIRFITGNVQNGVQPSQFYTHC